MKNSLMWWLCLQIVYIDVCSAQIQLLIELPGNPSGNSQTSSVTTQMTDTSATIKSTTRYDSTTESSLIQAAARSSEQTTTMEKSPAADESTNSDSTKENVTVSPTWNANSTTISLSETSLDETSSAQSTTSEASVTSSAEMPDRILTESSHLTASVSSLDTFTTTSPTFSMESLTTSSDTSAEMSSATTSTATLSATSNNLITTSNDPFTTSPITTTSNQKTTTVDMTSSNFSYETSSILQAITQTSTATPRSDSSSHGQSVLPEKSARTEGTQITTESTSQPFTSFATSSDSTTAQQGSVSYQLQNTGQTWHLCPCHCSSSMPSNITISQSVLAEIVKGINDQLYVQEKNLSSTIRKLTSAEDSRKSSQTIGTVGLIILVVGFGTIVVLDCTHLFKIG